MIPSRSSTEFTVESSASDDFPLRAIPNIRDNLHREDIGYCCVPDQQDSPERYGPEISSFKQKTLGDMQKRCLSTVARPIPGAAPLTVSNGGSNHPFESTRVAETNWPALFGRIKGSVALPTLSLWRIMISVMLATGCRQLAYPTIAVATPIFSNSATNSLRQKQESTTNNQSKCRSRHMSQSIYG